MQEFEQRQLSEYIDGSLDPQQIEELEAAIARDGELAQLEKDLRLMLQHTATQQVPEMRPEAYQDLRSRVQARYATPARPQRHWRPILAMAAMLLTAVGLGYYLGLDRATDQAMPQTAQNLLHEIEQTRLAFYTAIEKMEIQASVRLNSMPPEVALTFAGNLHMVNRLIDDCEKLIREYPEDFRAYASLSEAYRTKVKLLEKIMTT